MPKNILIFSDGTGQAGAAPRPARPLTSVAAETGAVIARR
jgi:hypothetical protein